MTRSLWMAWCSLLPLAVMAQAARPQAKPCLPRPAECQVSTPLFNFGRHEMSLTAAPVLAESTVSVTCTRARVPGLTVRVDFDLLGLPSDPGRLMRDRESGLLRYDMFVDSGRRQFWGDGSGGTKTITDRLDLNDVQPIVTRTYQVYGTVYGQQRADPGQWLGFVSVRLEYETKCK